MDNTSVGRFVADEAIFIYFYRLLPHFPSLLVILGLSNHFIKEGKIYYEHKYVKKDANALRQCNDDCSCNYFIFNF